jgi:thiol-disulfide isomerase/thioredoxin
MSEPTGENEDIKTPPLEKEVVVKPAKPKPRINWVLLGLLGLVVSASVAGVYWFRQASSERALEAEGALAPKNVSKGPLKAYAKGSLISLVTHDKPKPLQSISFFDRDKKPVALSDFKGRVVVLNVWATWCAPCIVEMPTLAGLQKRFDPEKVKVLALSIDEAKNTDKMKNLIDVNEPLDLYNDPEVQALSKWGVTGMPTTIILNKDGLEVARLSGEAHWDTPEVKAFLDHLSSQ